MNQNRIKAINIVNQLASKWSQNDDINIIK